MLALCLMLSGTYYAQNCASIIGWCLILFDMTHLYTVVITVPKSWSGILIKQSGLKWCPATKPCPDMIWHVQDRIVCSCMVWLTTRVITECDWDLSTDRQCVHMYINKELHNLLYYITFKKWNGFGKTVLSSWYL